MTCLRVIGIDPGPIPGLVLLLYGASHRFCGDPRVIQCSYNIAPLVLRALLEADPQIPTLVAIERFVIGRKSMRAGRAGEITRNLIMELTSVAAEVGRTTRPVSVCYRPASTVKPWATDKRLDEVGLLAATKGMQHARDAGRHALYAAVHNGGIPDPLSKRASH